MTPTQIDFLRDFAIDNLPRAQGDREQLTRFGGNLYDKLAFTSLMVGGNTDATATEHAAAAVLESVCLLQRQPPLRSKERADVLHNLTDAANGLCLHTGKTIAWLGQVAIPPDPRQEHTPVPPLLLPSISGKWLSTKEAAAFLKFKEQTLRQWASTESGPIRPNKVARRLKWSGDDILAVLRDRK